MIGMYDEDAQIEALKRWWGQNWKALVTVLTIGLAGIVGWQLWTRYEAGHRMQASQLYDELDNAMSGKGNTDIKTIVAHLKTSYDDTPYASFAELKLAQADVSNGRFEDANRRLNWIVDHGNDAGIRSIARLRLAAVLWQIGRDAEALKDLERPPQPFRGLYEELRGDILASQNKEAQAREAYQQALLVLPLGSSEHKNVQSKLANLATATIGTRSKPASATSGSADTKTRHP